MAEAPLCFVVMPYGSKPDPGGGGNIDFDRIYEQAIGPAIEDAGLTPIRADAEKTGGIIHKAMYERLLLCEFAVADMTTANANVFYELGVRHAARPYTTIPIYAAQHKVPFNVNLLRALPYDLGEGNRFSDAEAKALRQALKDRLLDLRREAAEGEPSDSPLFQLLDGYQAPDIRRLKTDIFRDRVRYSESLKAELKEIRKVQKPDELRAVQERLGELDRIEAGVLVDLFLSYRAVSDWQGMVDLYQELPAPLARTILLREQLGFAYNRLGDGDRALEILEGVEAEQGPSSETCGLIGRVYKDKWKQAKAEGAQAKARAFLDKAIDAYVRGFETDWRDHYPGINALTLLDIKGSEDALARKNELLPVVRFAVLQRLKSKKADYWDHATLLELAVLEGVEEAAGHHLGDALAAVREPWEPKSTADNLRLILEARQAQDRVPGWLPEIIQELEP